MYLYAAYRTLTLSAITAATKSLLAGCTRKLSNNNSYVRIFIKGLMRASALMRILLGPMTPGDAFVRGEVSRGPIGGGLDLLWQVLEGLEG